MSPPVAEPVVLNGRFLEQRATGVQRVARECIRALDRLTGEGRWPGIAFRLLVPEVPRASIDALGLAHIPVEVVPGGHGHAWEQIALARAAGGARLVCLGNAAPLLPLLRGGRVAVMIHDLAYRLFPEDYSRAYRAFHRIADGVILRRARPLVTVSATERAMLHQLNPRLRRTILVAANGSCADDIPPALGDPAARGEGPLLYVGAFSSRKNIEGVLAAALAVARGRGRATVLVGPPNAVSAAFAAQVPASLRPLIRFPGYVSNEELDELYRTAACLLYPSFYEASGLPPSEAMVRGCPVVASDLPVMRERCGDAALYCDPRDHDAITAAALRILDEPALAAELAARGRDQALGFTWRAQAIAIIEALLADPAG